MINFPKSTIIEKKIPKTRFYENIELSSKIKQKFVNYIDSIYLMNKFSKDTININPTNEVEEIFVFKVILKSEKYLSSVDELLLIIDRAVPYPILFQIFVNDVLKYLKIAKKERSKVDSNKFVIDIYLSKEFDTSFEKKFGNIYNALNLEVFYHNILRLFLENKKEDINSEIERHKLKLELEREIEKLEKTSFYCDGKKP